MKKSKKLWNKAKKIIPGGNMFLSKRPELHLPNKWPAYFSKSKDINIWDLDKKKYLDFCTMGVGTNILGYSNKVIDRAVKLQIEENKKKPKKVSKFQKRMDEIAKQQKRRR